MAEVIISFSGLHDLLIDIKIIMCGIRGIGYLLN